MAYKPKLLTVIEGGTGLATLTANAVYVGNGTTVPTALAVGSTGQVLTASTGANPGWSTATFPSTATSTGTILRADGTNWVATTTTYPNTNAVSTLLYASSANVMGALATANNSILSTDASGVPSLGTSLLNDYTFTSATASATRTLTVSNSDNTSGTSTAIIKALTGGASSGDAGFQASTTTTVWSFGVDNSVTSPTADPFVISQGTALGTNNIMSVATSGEINYPLQPAFFAYNSVTDADKTGDGTEYVMICDTEVYDQNADYNNSTGSFTAPVTGRYLFCTMVRLEQLGALFTAGSLYGRASNRDISIFSNFSGVMRNASNILEMGAAFFMDMDAGDGIDYRVNVSGSTKTIDIGGDSNAKTYFSGALIC